MRSVIGFFLSLMCFGGMAMADSLPNNNQVALPDPFTMLDGTKITTTDDWYNKRRPELKRLFQQYMYGFLPDAVAIEAKKEAAAVDVFDGAAEMRQVAIRFVGLPESAPRIHLILFVPKRVTAPAPVFLVLHNCGNHTLLSDPRILIQPSSFTHSSCNENPETDRNRSVDDWCVEYVISRGYAFASFRVDDLDPDKNDFTDGIHPFFPQADIPKDSRMSTICAWAWGMHRAVDYLVTLPEIDPKRVCVTGHSRRGKTALFTAAMDERIALVVPHQSGTGGMALSRGNDQETVKRINTIFPHWFCGAFKQFNHNEEALLFDQHLLVALVAPRPLLDTAGLQDEWANYESSLRNLKAASPVYEFLGAKGLQGDGIVQGDESITGPKFGAIMQFRLDTKHEMNKDYWRGILDFTDAHLASK